MPQITVIVPIYNNELSLSRCIESILRQSYTDFELLLVDDGSSDSSGSICDVYSQSDSRIRVFHKQNNGASSARNLGVKESRGKYIAFIDSDDYVSPYYLSELIGVIDDCQLAISGCNIVIGERVERAQLVKPGVINLRQAVLLIDKNLDFAPFRSPWAKLFMTDIIKRNHILFDEKMRIGEDTCFFFTYLSFCKKISISNLCQYYWGVAGNNLSKYSLSFFAFDYHYSRIISCLSLLENNTFLSMNEARLFFHDLFHELVFEYTRSTRNIALFFINRLLYLRRFGAEYKINLTGKYGNSDAVWSMILNSPICFLKDKIIRYLTRGLGRSKNSNNTKNGGA